MDINYEHLTQELFRIPRISLFARRIQPPLSFQTNVAYRWESPEPQMQTTLTVLDIRRQRHARLSGGLVRPLTKTIQPRLTGAGVAGYYSSKPMLGHWHSATQPAYHLRQSDEFYAVM